LTRSIEEYIEQLKAELAGSDPALIQDALYDAEEFLRSELEAAGEEEDREGVLAGAIERYGTPAEIAAAYRESEKHYVASRRQAPVPVAVPTPRTAAVAAGGLESFLGAVFGVYVDPRAYAALVYMVLSLATGVIYFSWVVTGVSLSLSLIILIIGIPFILLFLATTRAISLVEGWIIEAFLGVRMPRRPRLSGEDRQLFERIKYWLSDHRTWTTLVYMLVMLPLGVIYFTVAVTFLSLGLAFVVAPFIQWIWGYPMIHLDGYAYYLDWWTVPFSWALGILVITGTLHLARLVGRLHGGLAKSLLVGSL
jgi:hypothetical protein